jgi:Flp pilus assembly protein TadD
MAWPHDLIPFYRHPGLALTRAGIAGAATVLAGITAAALAVRSRRPWILAGWLWYLITLVPVIGLVQVGLQGKADRYTYLPSLGLCMAFTWEAASRGAGAKSTLLRAARGVAAAVIIATLSTLTWNQARLWKDTVTLFTRVATVDPKNYVAFNLLGSHYLQQGETARAQEFLTRSLSLKPGYLPARYNLALALSRRGERDAAISLFTALILADPNDAESLYNRGNILAEQGKAAEALRDFAAALALQPEEAEIHNRLGAMLADLGHLDEARHHFEEAVRLRPAYDEALANLARVSREKPALSHGGPP